MSPERDPTIKEALDGAASAIKRGDLEAGRAGLKWVLERDPNNVLAWLWMSRCVETNEAKLECFNRVLTIDPNNRHALEGVQRFGEGASGHKTPAAVGVASAARSAEDPPQRRSRLPLYVGVSGAIIAIVLCIGAIALIGGSNLASDVAQDASPPAEKEDEAEVQPGIPTEIPPPTETPVPTNTAEPSNTPEPTPTPKPTATQTPLPEPVTYSGSGASVVDVDKTEDAMIAHITGNSCSRHFSIWSIDANNENIDLLVNTSDPYEGTVALDFMVGEWTKRFDVDSECAWEITVMPLLMARSLAIPGVITGNGSDIVILTGQTPDLGIISGNAASRHFSIWGYGSVSDLLVNTSDPYEGTVLINAGIAVLEIDAVGNWSIEITAR